MMNSKVESADLFDDIYALPVDVRDVVLMHSNDTGVSACIALEAAIRLHV